MSITNLQAGGYKRLTATANVSPLPAACLGILCASTTAGTFQLYDSATTTTATPITGVVTPAAGSYTPINASAGAGLYLVITGTLDCTVIFA